MNIPNEPVVPAQEAGQSPAAGGFRGVVPPGEQSPGEVVTRAIVRDVDLGTAGLLALITLDNGHDHTKPNTFGVRGLLSLNAALDAISARVAAGEITAVGVTGKPFIL